MLLQRYKNFNRGTVKLKAHHEILTKADLMSEKIIITEIRKNFPKHRILSEEKGKIDSRSDYLWVIDPLDGTTNFSMHNPLWSVSIGVAFRGRIVLGIIYAPFLDELYIAEKGNGASRNGKKISVSKHTKKSLHTFCHGRNEKDVKRALKYYRKQKLNELDCRQLGSAALELAYVASGRIESIMIPGASSWDVAAGVLLVREAGGKVTDFQGREWRLTSKDMLASNGRVHQSVLKVISRK
jgi:myo-inositol-1(or 4)-monophosphatase